MPIATHILWQLDGERGECKEGKIDVILNSIFVNGIKRRRMIDMSTLPHHDGAGNIVLQFSCGGSIEAKLVGFVAAAAFVEDCIEVLVRRLGKGKLPPPACRAAEPETNPSACKNDVSSEQIGIVPPAGKDDLLGGQGPLNFVLGMDSNAVSESCSLSQKEDQKQAESSKQPHLSFEDCLDKAVLELPDNSFARTLLNKICVSKHAKSCSTSLRQLCEAFDKQASAREEKHGDDKKAIRSELIEAKEQCSRLLKGRELLEKEFKTLCARMEAADLEKKNLERLLREERSQSKPAAKRQRKADAAKSGTSATPVVETNDDFVHALAAMEVAPLQNCPESSREALKKKILFKWHPDKQPSDEHKTLSTKVMQAIQNEKAWTT